MSSADGTTVDGAMTVGDALKWATKALVATNVDSPRLDAELLMGHLLGVSRAGVYGRDREIMPRRLKVAYADLVRRRIAREPLAYIIGRRAFYDVELAVDPRVLIPRPETENLVEVALDWCRRMPLLNPRIVDVGTGSGAIAVVLAKHLPDAQVVAVDCSGEALAVARRNAESYGLGSRIRFVRSDLLTEVPGPFDVVAANLPYVPSKEVEQLQPEISRYEPFLALDGGADGTDVIMRLVAQLQMRLARPGLALFEIDRRQSLAIAECVQPALAPCEVHIVPDLAGLDRIVQVNALTG